MEKSITAIKRFSFWIKSDFRNAPFVINHQDGRVIFFIPHQEMVLVGTTEEDIDGEFENLSPSENETDYLLNIINEYLPIILSSKI